MLDLLLTSAEEIVVKRLRLEVLWAAVHDLENTDLAKTGVRTSNFRRANSRLFKELRWMRSSERLSLGT